MHTILFTGHMIDAPDRETPRFPAEKEAAVRATIRERILKVKRETTDSLKSVAGGACGGDILFLELCSELDIPAEMYLALPEEEFKKESVSFAGKDWDERFGKLTASLPVNVLSKTETDSSVWERANEWMLQTALKSGGENMSLVALWDGKGGDGPGGTEHMVNTTKQRGAAVEIIPINEI